MAVGWHLEQVKFVGKSLYLIPIFLNKSSFYRPFFSTHALWLKKDIVTSNKYLFHLAKQNWGKNIFMFYRFLTQKNLPLRFNWQNRELIDLRGVPNRAIRKFTKGGLAFTLFNIFYKEEIKHIFGFTFHCCFVLFYRIISHLSFKHYFIFISLREKNWLLMGCHRFYFSQVHCHFTLPSSE